MGLLNRDNIENILITDIGSTTTKGLLVARESGEYRFIAELEVPTTVEKPEEDVKIGVMGVVSSLEKKTGQEIIDSSGKINIPYISTSSAGGGLQIMVFGLHSAETGKIAKMTAYGAGGVILKTFTIDDEIPAIVKMEKIRELHPDIILMAGGLDGGAISGVVRMAELLTLAHPTPKFRQSERIPLVFCGNVQARSFVSHVLKDNFELHITENVRPSTEKINTAPAKEKVHQLFMKNVMERAPGYAGLKKWVSADIIPTPAGVEKIMGLYAQRSGKNLLMVDIGGATTDIFTTISGKYHRTVAANIGMSYSVSNILAEVGIDNIMRHLEEDLPEGFARDYIAGKTLNPTYVPRFDPEERIEGACAVEGLQWSWQQHVKMNFEATRLSFRQKRKLKYRINSYEDILSLKEGDLFQYSDIDEIAGAGGILSHTKTPQEAFWMLAEGFKPTGITKLSLDRVFKSPHMGVLSKLDPGLALELYQKECLKELGWVVAPVGKINEKHIALTICNNDTGENIILNWGQAAYVKGGDYTFKPGKKCVLGKTSDATDLKTKLPLLIDCRGRGKKMIDIPLARMDIKEFDFTYGEYRSRVRKSTARIVFGRYEVERKLPYEGEIRVRKESRVKPGDIVGINKYHPPQVYIFDIQKLIGYKRSLTEEEFKDGLFCKVGDKVVINQPICHYSKSRVLKTDINYLSPIRGVVESIDAKTKIIVIRELQDYDGKPHVINVAKFLSVRPRNIKAYLRFNKGEFIGYGRIIAPRFAFQGGGLLADENSTGTLKEIDTKKGTITIQYDLNPVCLNAFVGGEVTKVTDKYSATITGHGSTLYGIIGFGGEAFGKLAWLKDKADLDSSHKDKIVVASTEIDEAFLHKAADVEAAGIVAPSIHNVDWVRFYGEELGVALTGDEQIPFTLILTEGFGSFGMNKEYKEFFASSDGKLTSISGRTQVRAGATRPKVIVSE